MSERNEDHLTEDEQAFYATFRARRENSDGMELTPLSYIDVVTESLGDEDDAYPRPRDTVRLLVRDLSEGIMLHPLRREGDMPDTYTIPGVPLDDGSYLQFCLEVSPVTDITEITVIQAYPEPTGFPPVLTRDYVITELGQFIHTLTEVHGDDPGRERNVAQFDHDEEVIGPEALEKLYELQELVRPFLTEKDEATIEKRRMIGDMAHRAEAMIRSHSHYFEDQDDITATVTIPQDEGIDVSFTMACYEEIDFTDIVVSKRTDLSGDTPYIITEDFLLSTRGDFHYQRKILSDASDDTPDEEIDFDLIQPNFDERTDARLQEAEGLLSLLKS